MLFHFPVQAVAEYNNCDYDGKPIEEKWSSWASDKLEGRAIRSWPGSPEGCAASASPTATVAIRHIRGPSFHARSPHNLRPTPYLPKEIN